MASPSSRRAAGRTARCWAAQGCWWIPTARAISPRRSSGCSGTTSSQPDAHGAALPAFTFTTSGLTNGDAVSSVTQTTAASPTAAVGSYALTPSAAVFSTGSAANYTITSPTGNLATIPRPITDAVLTFSAPQTGTVQIVGARRPRRTAQFSENRGVTARDLNQVITDIVAMLREDWDKINDVTGRAVLAAPGETMALLPAKGYPHLIAELAVRTWLLVAPNDVNRRVQFFPQTLTQAAAA